MTNIDLEQLKKFARERYIPVMLDDTREFLFETVKNCAPKRILEIGTAIGYSGIIMLSASPNATLNTIEMNENSAELARQNFEKAQMQKRVNVFVGDAREIVPLLSGSYDFIFMDGPKGQYEVFLPYLTNLLEVGGTLFCDNVYYKGLALNVPENKRHKHITVARNMHEFLHDISTNSHYKTVLHNVGDGVSVSTKIQ